LPKTLVIIGAGAAGVFAAINAATANPQLKIIILEKSSKILSKVRVSGGGRCNVTHACYDIPEMSRRYPRGANFVKKTFHKFFTTDTIKWFEERGVVLKAEADGRMFPVTDTSQTIIDCLIKEVNRFGIEIRMNAAVEKIINDKGRFLLKLSGGRQLESDFVCVACGGFPKLQMFEWLEQTGHTIEEPVPSLFTFNLPSHPITRLMGVSVENAKAKVIGSKLETEGALLITHWGLSGPAILKLSAWGARIFSSMNWEFSALINWLPKQTESDIKDRFRAMRVTDAGMRVMGKNSLGLPQRLWEFFCEDAGINGDTRWAELKAKDENKLIRNLHLFEVTVKGKTTFKEEFVTAGGIKLSEVDPQTMMSRKCENLYFAGEILDIDGITGGYNFQHAWTSGYIAGKSIAESALRNQSI
jgi:predicted Rossmann fold flavoprotein